MEANLYLNTVDPCRYWPLNANIPCDEALNLIKSGKANVNEYEFLSVKKQQAFKLVLNASKILPTVPLITVPQPVESGLLPINEPDENSLVIATSNNSITLEVLTTVWAQGLTPAYFLLVDTKGNTVDMAMVFGDFTPERLAQGISESGLKNKVKHRQMIVPGFTAPLASNFNAVTGWEIEVGPVCAAELPLFLGDRWIPIG